MGNVQSALEDKLKPKKSSSQNVPAAEQTAGSAKRYEAGTYYCPKQECKRQVKMEEDLDEDELPKCKKHKKKFVLRYIG